LILGSITKEENNDVLVRYRSNSVLYSSIEKTEDVATCIKKIMDKFAKMPESIKYIELSEK